MGEIGRCIYVVCASVSEKARKEIIDVSPVVPAMVAPCQGRKKMTRPSLVDGSNMPISTGL